MRGRFPSQHRFPGGFTVDIELQERHPGSKHPEHILDEADDEAAYVHVSKERGLIVLWTELTPKQKWHALMHELQHALVDAQNYVEERLK